MKSKDQIAGIIRALLMKTVENGASDAEAISAAEKARELLDRYRLNMTDVEAEPVLTEGIARSRRGIVSIADQLRAAVGEYCDCIGWATSSGNHPMFTGRQGDILFATWLLDALDGYCARRIVAYVASRPYGHKNAELLAFKAGLVARLKERLVAATAARSATARQQAQAANTLALRGQGVNLVLKSTLGAPIRSKDSYTAGQAQGDGASFSRPAGAGAKVYQLASYR